jgi:hypothetical protein
MIQMKGMQGWYSGFMVLFLKVCFDFFYIDFATAFAAFTRIALGG